MPHRRGTLAAQKCSSTGGQFNFVGLVAPLICAATSVETGGRRHRDYGWQACEPQHGCRRSLSVTMLENQPTPSRRRAAAAHCCSRRRRRRTRSGGCRASRQPCYASALRPTWPSAARRARVTAVELRQRSLLSHNALIAVSGCLCCLSAALLRSLAAQARPRHAGGRLHVARRRTRSKSLPF